MAQNHLQKQVTTTKTSSIGKATKRPSRKAERGHGKSSSAFRTISEVASELGVQQHVLRFWESKFTQVKPMKRGGGRRYYRPEDVELLKRIHHLLYDEGYTIKGVQKLMQSSKGTLLQEAAKESASMAVSEDTASLEDQAKVLKSQVRKYKGELTSLLADLKVMKKMLKV